MQRNMNKTYNQELQSLNALQLRKYAWMKEKSLYSNIAHRVSVKAVNF